MYSLLYKHLDGKNETALHLHLCVESAWINDFKYKLIKSDYAGDIIFPKGDSFSELFQYNKSKFSIPEQSLYDAHGSGRSGIQIKHSKNDCAQLCDVSRASVGRTPVVGPGTTEAEGITSKMVPRDSLSWPLSCKVKECATCMWWF